MRGPLIVLGFLAFSQAFAESLSVERQTALLNLLRQDCGSCHGMSLRGGLGPALLPETLVGKTDAFLVETILNGRPDTAMPPWRGFFSPDEALWLVRQLRKSP
jgi:cytochrome c55X